MWIAELDAVLQLHLVQLNEETARRMAWCGVRRRVALCVWYVISLPRVFSD